MFQSRQEDTPWQSCSQLLQFDVVDTGIGMPQHEIAGLFEPFVQGDSRPARKLPGTGLGLAISRRLAEMLGGSISVASKPKEGSTFSVTIATGTLDGVRMLEHLDETAAGTDQENRQAATLSIGLEGRVLLAEQEQKNRSGGTR